MVSFEHIVNVTYGDVNNDSAHEQYGDFTEFSSAFNVGSSFDLFVTIDQYDSDYVYAWVDWNQDFEFSNDEKVVLALTKGSKVLNGTVNVPADAKIGKTRMRIACRCANEPTPCGEWFIGEVEDYSVDVVEGGIFAMFSASSQEVGVNQEVTFTESCIGNDKITSYLWNFGEGASPATFQGLIPPAVVYSTVGYKTVSLTVSDGTESVTTTKENFISVVTGSAEFAKPKYVGASTDHNIINILWYAPIEQATLKGTEGFENGTFPPAGWELKVSDDLTSDLTDHTEGYVTWNLTSLDWNVHSGKYAAVIAYNKQKSNWLITPDVTIGEAKQLSFWMFYKSDNFSGEFPGYHTKFDVMVKEGDAPWTNLKSFGEGSPSNYMEEVVTADLAAYAGKTVKIAFVHTYSDGYNVAIDDICIEDNTTKHNRSFSASKLMRTPSSAIESLQTTNRSDIVATGREIVPEVKYSINKSTKADATPSGYKVFVDGIQKGGVLAADARSYKIENVDAGRHTCSVSSVYTEGESFVTTPINVEATDPKVSFTSDLDKAGIGEEFTFTGEVLGSYNSVQWNFGEDATPSTSNDIVTKVKYSTLGNKTVSLTINGKVVKEMINCIRVVPGSKNVEPLLGVTATADYQDITIKWPLLTEDIKVNNDFEDAWPQVGWSVKQSTTLDGELTDPETTDDLNSWSQINAGSFGGNYPQFIHSGDYAAGIAYTAPGFNWLITPKVTVESGDNLKFWAWYYNGSSGGVYCYTNFRVMIKSDDVWNEALFYTSGSEVNAYTSEIVVDLNAYAGKEIQIAFVYENTDGWQMMIDDVSIKGLGTRTPLSADFSKLNIYKDDVIVDEITDATVTEWVDADLPTGEYKYYVTFVNAAGQESYPTKDLYVRAYHKVDAPYEQTFESDYSDWIFFSGNHTFAVGANGDFDTDTYSIPAREGNYVAVNTSDVPGTMFGYTQAVDIAEFDAINLDSYGRAFFELDYVADLPGFAITGRENPSDDWRLIKQLNYSQDWTYEKFILPAECLKEGYQFGILYSNQKQPSKGCAFDNIKVYGTEGKHIIIESNGAELESGATKNLGLIKNGTTRDYIIKIKNIGNEAINLFDIKLEGDKYTLKSIPTNGTVLAVQGVAEVVVTYTPTEETTTPDLATLTIGSDAEENPYTIILSAECGTSAWTYMVYLYEDQTGLDGNKDINEWEVLGSIPGKVNYIVLYDCNDDSKDGIYYITKDPGGMNNEIISERISTHLNEGLDMNNSQTLEDFILWVKEYYPADHYGCNVWDHGDGIFRRNNMQWRAACGHMKVWDLASAVKSFKEVDGKGFDIFGFDVCLLGQVETVYDIKDYTDIVIASERTEPGDGWDYTTHFKMLNDNNGNVDIYEFAANIVEEFDASYNNGTQGIQSTTQAATRTDLFNEEFIPALNTFAETASIEIFDIKDQVNAARQEAWYANDVVDHIDLGNFLTILKGKEGLSDKLLNKIDNLLFAYNNCIIKSLENGHEGQATGLKIWFPEDINADVNKDFYLQSDKYLKIAETKWDEFLIMFANPIAVGKPEPVIKALSTENIFTGKTVKLQDATFCNPEATGREWKITPNSYEFVSGDANAKTIEVKFNAEGKYTVSLDVTNSEGTGTIEMVDMITVKDQFPKPTNLTANLNNDTRVVSLAWNKPASDDNGDETGDTDKLVEGFEGDIAANGWSIQHSKTLTGVLSNPEEGTETWSRMDAGSFGGNNPEYVHSGTYSAGITYSAKEFNWLITKELTVTAQDNLKFWLWYKNGIAAGDGNYYYTNFRVMILLDGVWSEALYYTDGEEANGYDSEVVVSLADYAGKTINIAFVYEYTDGFQLMVDDIYVGTGNNPASTRRMTPVSNVSRMAKTTSYARLDRAVVSYDVYRNDEKIANVSKLTHDDQLSDESGDYEYYVVAVYESPEGLSEASNKVSVNIEKKEEEEVTAIGDGIELDVTAYPNPNNGTFTLNVSNANNVQWYLLDISGRIVNSGVSNENNIVITAEKAGVYMVKVISDQKTTVLKVIVK